jgi:hypothetical protein
MSKECVMTVQNLTTARFVLQCLLDELEEFDRCIPVARKLQVGDVADALLVILNDRELQRLTTPNARSRRRARRLPRPPRPAVAKRKPRVAAQRARAHTASLRKSGTASRSTR